MTRSRHGLAAAAELRRTREPDPVEHAEFIDGWRAGKLDLEIDPDRAMRVVTAGGFATSRRAAVVRAVYSGLWTLGLLTAISVMIGCSPWAGFCLLVAVVLLPAGIKTAASHRVRTRLLADPVFFQRAARAGVFRVTEKP